MTRAATTQREADAYEDGRCASAPHQYVRLPCGACGQNMETRDKFTFADWAVHPRCALITAEGAGDAGEDRFGVEVVGEVGRPRRGAVHLVDVLTRLYMRIDGAVSGGGDQQLRIARLWEDVPSGAGDEEDARDGGWRFRVKPVIEVGDEPCSYCEWALHDPINGLGGINAPIQIPCNHGGRVQGRCMLERAGRIAPGDADPRFCLECQSDLPEHSSSSRTCPSNTRDRARCRSEVVEDV